MTTKPLLRVLALACFLTTRSVSIEAGQLTNYTSSWFGNTFGGGSGWVQQEIAGIYVTTNGIVYANVYWDEGGGNFSAYQNGALIATGLHCHGWGRNGGNAVCVNSNYVFFSQRADNEGGALVDSNTNTDSWPPVGYNWYGVTRRLRSNITQGAPFAGGKGGSGDTLANSYLVVNQVPTSYSGGDIQGLYATDTRLYVSCPYDGYIRVYDANSMVFLWSFAVSNPGSLTMDANGKLWLVEQGTNRVDRYNTNGTLEATLTLPAGAVPSGISVDSQNRLFIADDGTNEQVLIYTNLAGSPNLSGTFGTTGGIYSGIRGATGPLKFHNIAGAGADGAGNIYVCSTRGVGNHTTSGSNNGGTILESYTPAGAGIGSCLGCCLSMPGWWTRETRPRFTPRTPITPWIIASPPASSGLARALRLIISLTRKTRGPKPYPSNRASARLHSSSGLTERNSFLPVSSRMFFPSVFTGSRPTKSLCLAR